MTDQPRTAAGRDMLEWEDDPRFHEEARIRILAIEAEAAAPGELLGETVEHDGSLIQYVQIVAPLDVERLARAYPAARARAGDWRALDPLRQAVMIRDEYARLASADELDVVLRDGNPALRGKWSR